MSQDSDESDRYPIRTLRDIFNLPTIAMMETCIDELKAGMLQARQANDVTVVLLNKVGAGIVKAFEWPEVIDWKDDGRGEVHTKYGGPDGKAVMTLKAEVPNPLMSHGTGCKCNNEAEADVPKCHMDFSVCDNCKSEVFLTTNEGHVKDCKEVWGRRGWRQLGEYDG